MAMSFMKSWLRITGPSDAVMSHPRSPFAFVAVAIVTSLFRLIASFLARARLEYNSKLAFFTRWLWTRDVKLGMAIVASMPATAHTTNNSVSVKPETDVEEDFILMDYQVVAAPWVLLPRSSRVRFPSPSCLLPATGAAVIVSEGGGPAR